MKSGHIFDGETLENSNKVLTWHDEAGYRFWIGAVMSRSGSWSIVSLEIQTLSQNLARPSKEELKTRLKLMVVASESTIDFTASLFRNLPLGEVFFERAELLMSIRSRESLNLGRIRLVDEATRNKGMRQSSKRRGLSQRLISGASTTDSILVAKIYADQCIVSTVRAAQRTAEFLGVETSLVHVCLKIARRNGWLTSNGPGKAGGELSKKGSEEFLKSNGREREQEIQMRAGTR